MSASRRSAWIGVTLLVLLAVATTVRAGDFLQEQLTFPRVRAAKAETDSVLRAMCTARHLHYPPREVFLRAFKREGILEIWARDSVAAPFTLLTDYAICQRSGELGPKRREGDKQVPEGFYTINIYNPVSDYHLSLGVSYPNASDSLLGNKPKLGGDIMIHGDCVTIGCIPITDPCIRQVYWLVIQVHDAGMAQIPVHIFPCRMDEAGMEYLAGERPGDLATQAFWKTLEPGFAAFQRTRMLPVIGVDAHGAYTVRGR